MESGAMEGTQSFARASDNILSNSQTAQAAASALQYKHQNGKPMANVLVFRELQHGSAAKSTIILHSSDKTLLSIHGAFLESQRMKSVARACSIDYLDACNKRRDQQKDNNAHSGTFKLPTTHAPLQDMPHGAEQHSIPPPPGVVYDLEHPIKDGTPQRHNIPSQKKGCRAPKKALTAYMAFCCAVRKKMREEFTDTTHLTIQQVTQKIEHRWSTLSDEEKIPYIDMAERDKVRHAREMSPYGLLRPKKEREVRTSTVQSVAYGLLRPKKALTPYMAFSGAMRNKMREEFPDYTMQQLTQKIGERWSHMPDGEKTSFVRIADLDKVRYAREKAMMVDGEGSSSLPSMTSGSATATPSKKDRQGPKKALTPYMAFSGAMRNKMREEFPDLTMQQLTGKIGQRWSSLSDEHKIPYVNMAAQDKVRRAREMHCYEKWGLMPDEKTAFIESMQGQDQDQDQDKLSAVEEESMQGHGEKVEHMERNAKALLFCDKHESPTLSDESPTPFDESSTLTDESPSTCDVGSIDAERGEEQAVEAQAHSRTQSKDEQAVEQETQDQDQDQDQDKLSAAEEETQEQDSNEFQEKPKDGDDVPEIDIELWRSSVSSSGFRGVQKVRGRYTAHILLPIGGRKFLGSYATAVQAAKAYAKTSLLAYGKPSPDETLSERKRTKLDTKEERKRTKVDTEGSHGRFGIVSNDPESKSKKPRLDVPEVADIDSGMPSTSGMELSEGDEGGSEYESRRVGVEKDAEVTNVADWRWEGHERVGMRVARLYDMDREKVIVCGTITKWLPAGKLEEDIGLWR